MHYLFFILLAWIPVSSFYENDIDPQSLPNELLFEGKPIPDDVLEDFFSFAVVGFGEPELELNISKTIWEEKQKTDVDKPETVFDWEYVGTIQKEFQVVRVYTWEVGCMGKFTGLLILKREGDLLKIVDIIYGGDRHSSMIREGCRIDGNLITYTQCVTTGTIFSIAREENFEEEWDYSKFEGLICYGEAGFYGCFNMAAEIAPNGKQKAIHIIDYIPCEGCEYQNELYKKGGLKAIALDLLTQESPF